MDWKLFGITRRYHSLWCNIIHMKLKNIIIENTKKVIKNIFMIRTNCLYRYYMHKNYLFGSQTQFSIHIFIFLATVLSYIYHLTKSVNNYFKKLSIQNRKLWGVNSTSFSFSFYKWEDSNVKSITYGKLYYINSTFFLI